jgi:catechol 2,3-dioxygenase-like lactoylglutathione lyase family enzyme
MDQNQQTRVPRVMGLLEGCLYVDDLSRSYDFYHRLFGFEKEVADHTICVMRVKDGQFLILFPRSIADEPGRTSSAAGEFAGMLPPHGAQGRIHMCFAIHSADIPQWREKLAAENVTIEGTVRWHRGGTSMYFRDPDDHMLELATRGVWPSY